MTAQAPLRPGPEVKPRRDWRRALGVALLVLLVLEAALRLTIYDELHRQEWIPDTFLRPMYETSVQRLWALRPGTWRESGVEYRINSLGLRGPEPEAAPAVLVMGDSCTFGFRVAEEDSIPRVLEAELSRRAGRPVPVWNGGVPGYTSSQGLRHFRDLVQRARPEVAVVAYLNNDVTTGDLPDDRLLPGPVAAALQESLRPVCLYQFLRQSRRSLGLLKDALLPEAWGDVVVDEVAAEPRQVRVDPEQFRRNLETFAREGRAAGIQVVFLVLPDALPQGERDVLAMARRDRQEALRVAGVEGARVVDLGSLWPGDPSDREEWFQEDRFHPNASGARRIGEALAEGLWREGLPRAR